MAQQKKILVSLPDSLLSEIDDFVSKDHVNRSEFVREAMKHYIGQRKKQEVRERMKRGYIEMGKINLTIANACVSADEKQQVTYEQFISESENSDCKTW